MEEIIRRDSLLSTSEDFTQSVLGRLREKRAEQSYKPLIGKRAGIIVMTIVSILVLAAVLSTSGEAAEPLIHLPELKFSLPQTGWKLPSALLAGIAALFVLIITDTSLRRNRI